MSLISKLAKMSVTERSAFLAEQNAAAEMLAKKAETSVSAKAAFVAAIETLETETAAQIAAIENEAETRVSTLAAEVAAKFGVDAATLRRGSSLSGVTVAVRYRNPADHGQTWTGRGKQPLWIAAIGGLENCEDLRPKADIAA